MNAFFLVPAYLLIGILTGCLYLYCEKRQTTALDKSDYSLAKLMILGWPLLLPVMLIILIGYGIDSFYRKLF